MDVDSFGRRPKPEWLRVPAPGGENFKEIKELLRSQNLHTVCEEAKCPNLGECWAGGTATFMLLGDVCTRGCKFCAVTTGNPKMQLDPHEPEKIANSVAKLQLRYIVLTSVDRDDLPDQGASHFATTVRLTKSLRPDVWVETLTPDWRGNVDCMIAMVESGVDVLSHNVETVERLQLRVRDPRAGYAQSLKVLEVYKNEAARRGRMVVTKSSLMLGLGEEPHELAQTFQDLLNAGVEVLTLGQYLQPSPRHLPVHEYLSPDVFTHWAREGERMGFQYVAAGPLVRSSYKAGEYYIEKILHGKRSHGDLLDGAWERSRRSQSASDGDRVG